MTKSLFMLTIYISSKYKHQWRVSAGQSLSAFQLIIRVRPFDFWGGRRVWVISEKNMLQTDFEGKKSCKVIPREKILALKKYLSWPIMLGKKSYTVVCQKKIQTPEVWEERNSYPNQITHTSQPPTPNPFRNQMVGPQKVTILLRPSIIATLTKKIIFAFYSYYNQKNRRKRVETSHSSAEQNTFCIYCFLFFS